MKKRLIISLLLLIALLVLFGGIACSNSSTVRKVVVASTEGDWSGLATDYICDGIDDQIEIQMALNSLASEGGVLELLAGNYYKSSAEPILIPSNIYISMERAIISQADVANSTQEMVFSNADFEGEGNNNITIEGGLIQGTSYMALNFKGVRMFRLEDMEFNGIGKEFSVYGVGVKIWSGENIIIRVGYFHVVRTGLFLSVITIWLF